MKTILLFVSTEKEEETKQPSNTRTSIEIDCIAFADPYFFFCIIYPQTYFSSLCCVRGACFIFIFRRLRVLSAMPIFGHKTKHNI